MCTDLTITNIPNIQSHKVGIGEGRMHIDLTLTLEVGEVVSDKPSTETNI